MHAWGRLVCLVRAAVLGWRSCNSAFIGLGIKNSGVQDSEGRGRGLAKMSVFLMDVIT